MRSLFVVGFLLVFSTWGGQAVHAQPAAGAAPHIEWEVKNRFRLFRNEADFQRHVAAMRSDGVLAAERRLASETDGRGWARDMIERLCVDRAGLLLEFCDRDGERESYLAPRDHRVGEKDLRFASMTGPHDLIGQTLGCDGHRFGGSRRHTS